MPFSLIWIFAFTTACDVSGLNIELASYHSVHSAPGMIIRYVASDTKINIVELIHCASVQHL